MKNIITLDEFEKELAIDCTPEDINTIADGYRKAISIDDAAKMVETITEKISEQTKSNPDIAAEFSTWSATDKTLFVARELYTMGAVEATVTTAAAIAKIATQILSESEIAYPIHKG